MSEINYEEEVKKVYPRSYCDTFHENKLDGDCIVWADGSWYLPTSLGRGPHPIDAWESAYNQLKQKGEIK